MNNKGFTLIELMGVIVILSIIMLIAIPNVTATLEKTKKDSYIADAKKFVSLVQYQIRMDTIPKPAAGDTIKITLRDLDTDQISTDSDGIAYDKDNSYVLIQVVDGYVTYRVQLVTNGSNNCSKARGIKSSAYEDLDGDQRYSTYSTSIDVCPKVNS